SIESGEQEIGRVAELQRERRVDDVARRISEVQEAALVAHRLGHRRYEGDHVVLHLRLDLLHPSDVDLGALTECPRRVGGDRPPLRQDVDEGELDLEPVPETRLLAPDPRHLRPRIALDHRRSVLPNPPPPRVVGASDSSSVHSMRTTGATTSCAMRSPRRTTALSSPRFTSSTCISPR